MSRICSPLAEGQNQFKTAKVDRQRVPRQRKALRRMSDRRRKESAIYSQKRNQFMYEHPICEFGGCFARSEDCHHKAGHGVNYLNEETWLALCRHHHSWIHSHTRKARELGLLAPIS